MAYWQNTRGLNRIAIAICDRCRRKRPWVALTPDGNSPGLRVCDSPYLGCKDPLDPRRLPPRPPDQITLDFVRPDVELDASQPDPPPTGLPIQDIDLFN